MKPISNKILTYRVKTAAYDVHPMAPGRVVIERGRDEHYVYYYYEGRPESIFSQYIEFFTEKTEEI